jgi:hypothetical protein
MGPPQDHDPGVGRLLWGAGPTGDPAPWHGYNLYPAGRAFLDAQQAQAAPESHPA